MDQLDQKIEELKANIRAEMQRHEHLLRELEGIQERRKQIKHERDESDILRIQQAIKNL